MTHFQRDQLLPIALMAPQPPQPPRRCRRRYHLYRHRRHRYRRCAQTKRGLAAWVAVAAWVVRWAVAASSVAAAALSVVVVAIAARRHRRHKVACCTVACEQRRSQSGFQGCSAKVARCRRARCSGRHVLRLLPPLKESRGRWRLRCGSPARQDRSCCGASLLVWCWRCYHCVCRRRRLRPDAWAWTLKSSPVRESRPRRRRGPRRRMACGRAETGRGRAVRRGRGSWPNHPAAVPSRRASPTAAQPTWRLVPPAQSTDPVGRVLADGPGIGREGPRTRPTR